MAAYFTLDSENFQEAIDSTTIALNLGGIAIVAAEHGYLYVCNAFDHEAVSSIHIMRGDAEYTACQVMVGSADVLEGLAADFDQDLQKLVAKFWPGLLTIHFTPHSGLNWDLGDAGALSEFAVRVPAKDFLRAVAHSVGPLAVASAAITGRPPTREINFVPALESSIAIYVDEGVLPEGPGSTVIQRQRQSGASSLTVIREGAISRAQLAELVPTIGA